MATFIIQLWFELFSLLDVHFSLFNCYINHCDCCLYILYELQDPQLQVLVVFYRTMAFLFESKICYQYHSQYQGERTVLKKCVCVCVEGGGGVSYKVFFLKPLTVP